MIKKRGFIVAMLLILIGIVSYSVVSSPFLPQVGNKQGSDLLSIDTYEGTSMLYLEMFVGCIKFLENDPSTTSDDESIGSIPYYTSSSFLDLKSLSPKAPKPTWIFNTDWTKLIEYNDLTAIPTLTIPWEEGTKSYTYEGDCSLFLNYWHRRWVDGEEIKNEDDGPYLVMDTEHDVYKSDDSVINGLNVKPVSTMYGLTEPPFKDSYFVDDSDYKYSVYWEGGVLDFNIEKTNCENFGGFYQDVGGNKVKNCCGDDYLWIMNGVYNFDGNQEDKSVDELCLYGYVDPETGEPIVESSESQPYHSSDSSAKVGNHPYRKGVYCTPLPAVDGASDIHYSYDIDNYDPLSTTETRKLFFYDPNNPSNTVTDVGLWKSDTTANYCTHYFSDKVDGTIKKGDNFEWLSPEKAGEIHYFGVDDGTKAFNNDNIPKLKTTNGEEQFTLNPKAPDYIYDVMTKQLSGDNYANSDDFTICNLFLNGTWTGHHCCGNKYNADGTKLLENFNDESEDGTHYVLAKNRLATYALSAESSDEVWKEPNKACYQGEAIESGEIRNYNINPADAFLVGDKIRSFINKKGNLFLCSNLTNYYDINEEKQYFGDTLGKSYNFETFANENNYLFYDDTKKELKNVQTSCGSFYLKTSDDLISTNNRFAYCFTNNTWLSFDIQDQPYEEGTNPEFDILGRYPKEGEGLTESEINEDFDEFMPQSINSNKGCCFQGDCWNGNKCIANGKTIVNKNAEPNKVYLCANGDWTSGEASFNWYDEKFAGETDPSQTGLQYCVDKWACACPEKDAYDLGDEDQHEIDVCETYTKPESLCTREPAMFIGDRFCEPKYEKEKDANGAVTDYNFKNPITISSSQWTSRTKYLATALLHLAQKQNSPNFVLHCDTSKNVLNFYDLNFAEDLFVTEQDYNNFCVLTLKTNDGINTNEEVYLGTTLNPQLNYDEIPEQLYLTQEISEFEQCQDDDSCIEGYGCYKSSGANTGKCVKQCYDDNECEENEECMFETINGEEALSGLCAEKAPKTFDMLDINNLGELFYGTSDTTGLLDNSFLFDLASQTLSEEDCKTEISSTNSIDNDNYLIFNTCKEPKIAYNNFTKAMIFSNNSFDEQLLNKLAVSYELDNNVDIAFIDETLSSSLTTYYNDNKDKIAEKKEMSIINSISDLDKIYFAQKGDKIIFGVLERKSDPDASGDPSSKLRYFVVIMYKNIFDDDKVCKELEKTSPLLYCGFKQYDNPSSTIVVIIIPSTPNYEGTDDAVMSYWSDLTVKIRMK